MVLERKSDEGRGHEPSRSQSREGFGKRPHHWDRGELSIPAVVFQTVTPGWRCYRRVFSVRDTRADESVALPSECEHGEDRAVDDDRSDAKCPLRVAIFWGPVTM